MYELPKISIEDILLYSRKSRTDDPSLTVEEVLSKHEQMLDEWVERNLPGQGRIPEANRFREVVSGETIKSRPQVQAMLRLIESPKYKAVLIVEPQRLSRGDLEDIGRMVNLLRYSNTFVITLQYMYDLRDERDRDLFERELKRGNEYLEYQKRIMNNGRLLSVQNGNFIGNHAPYGYKKIEIKEGKKKCYTLEPIPEEAPAVKLIFDMYAQGIGSTRICDKLEELGFKPRDAKHWTEPTIRGILKNEHYIGKVRWNHKQTTRSVVEGEIIVRSKRKDDYLLFDGKQPAIIEQEVWDKVQAKFGAIPRNHKAGNFVNPLAGLLFCSCGKTMRRRGYFVNGVQKAEARFECAQRKHCNNGSCTVAELLAEVKKKLKESLEDFEIHIEKKEDNTLELHRQQIQRLEKRIEELEKLELSQWDKYTQEDMPKHIFERLNAKVLEEKEEVRQTLNNLLASIPEPVDYEERAETFRAAIEMLENPKAPAKELNNLLKSCIKSITYSRPKFDAAHSRRRIEEPFTLDIELRC